MAATTDPKSKARDAFADLPTPEKTAFVIEATFSTIGQALRETGQRLADVITDFDPEDFFRDEAAPEAAAAPKKAAPKKKAAAKSARAKKPAATKPTATKTAGKPKKRGDG